MAGALSLSKAERQTYYRFQRGMILSPEWILSQVLGSIKIAVMMSVKNLQFIKMLDVGKESSL